jgi:general secretion pathway protein J
MRALAGTAARPSGFTLIEVMLAMAITAFIAIIAYSGLSAAINASERQQLQVQKLGDIQLSLSVLERDIRYAVLRAIVDEYGDRQPAMLGGTQQDYILQVTRSGWDNPADQRRSELQRVRYLLEGDQLWRESWRVLDRLDSEDGLQRVLLMAGVTTFDIAFLDDKSSSASQSPLGGEWIEDWSPEAGVDRLPKALEITLEIENFGQVRRVFEILQ